MESSQPSEANQAWESLVSLKEKYEEGAKIQEEWQKKVDYVNYIVTYTSEDKKTKKARKRKLKGFKKLKNLDLTESLKGSVYDIEFEKLFDPDRIMEIIKEWLKTLHCAKCDCKNEAKMVYIDEGLDQIYCENHAILTEFQTTPLKFEHELGSKESLLSALEKNLIYTQKQMAKIRSENFNNSPNSSISEKMETLESTFNKLKNTLNTLWIRVELVIKKEKSETTTRSDQNKYVSLDFIQEKWKRCNRFCSKIDSIISEMQKDKQVDYIIQTWVNSQNKNAKFEEEFKYSPYAKVPSEIYGKKYVLVDPSVQSAILIKKFEDKIK